MLTNRYVIKMHDELACANYLLSSDERVMKNIIVQLAQTPTLHDTHGTVVIYLFVLCGQRYCLA